MPAPRFRVTVNGFRAVSQTWDDVFNWDGWGDEIQIRTVVKVLDAYGSEIYSNNPTSDVMGDISADIPVIQAGTGKVTGGLVAGDTFPTSEPWKKSRTANLQLNRPPFAVWEGELPQGGRVALISVAIYEYDPGASPLQDLLKWMSSSIPKFKEKVSSFLGPTGKVIFDGIELGFGILGSLDDAGIFGQSGTKPIGIARSTTEANKGDFTPKVLVLNHDNAMQIVNDRPSGKGYGVLEFPYPNDPYYRGEYSIYVQVEYLIDEATVVIADNGDPKVYTVVGGSKLWIDHPDQLIQRYGGWNQVVRVPFGALQSMPDYPQDGTLIQEWDQHEVYVMIAGARVWIPNPDELNRYYGGGISIRKVPVGTIARLSDRPQPGVWFKERTTAKQAMFDHQGVKISWTGPSWFTFPGAYPVPDGTLDRIP